ncbi:MAG: hypothetical protein LBO05_07415 [Deltaproteobacteria bacterium]|nr:hypothetical protein [Deltaproteobacteria bacterium]
MRAFYLDQLFVQKGKALRKGLREAFDMMSFFLPSPQDLIGDALSSIFQDLFLPPSPWSFGRFRFC